MHETIIYYINLYLKNKRICAVLLQLMLKLPFLTMFHSMFHAVLQFFSEPVRYLILYCEKPKQKYKVFARFFPSALSR